MSGLGEKGQPRASPPLSTWGKVSCSLVPHTKGQIPKNLTVDREKTMALTCIKEHTRRQQP